MPPVKKSATASPGAPAALHLFFGTDDLTAAQRANALVEKLCPPENQAFGLEIFDLETGLKADDIVSSIQQVREALATDSFLGGEKTVYLKNATFFNPRTEPGKFANVKTAVEQLVADLKKGLLPGHTFVVLASGVDKTTAFYKLFKSAGTVTECAEAEKPKEATETFFPAVQELLKEKGIEMPHDVVNALIARTGYSLRQVSMEIEKLSLYAGDRRKITLGDIELMVASVKETKFWEFADIYCNGRLAPALACLRRCFTQGIFPVPLITNLQNRLRELLVLRDCLDRRWAILSGNQSWPKLEWNPPPEGETLLETLETDPRKMNPFRAGILAGQAAKFPAGRWAKWLEAAVTAQADMTGDAKIPPETTLELFTIRTLGALIAEKSRPA